MGLLLYFLKQWQQRWRQQDLLYAGLSGKGTIPPVWYWIKKHQQNKAFSFSGRVFPGTRGGAGESANLMNHLEDYPPAACATARLPCVSVMPHLFPRARVLLERGESQTGFLFWKRGGLERKRMCGKWWCIMLIQGPQSCGASPPIFTSTQTSAHMVYE